MRLALPYLILQLALLAGLLTSRRGLRAFLAAHAAIVDTGALAAFKRLARAQMYGALYALALGLVLIPYNVVLTFSLGLPGLVLVLVPCGLGFALGKATKALETRARTLPFVPVLQAEYTGVGEVWMKRALPRF